MKATHCVAFILTIIGGLNWGLLGLGYWFQHNWNVVDLLLGRWPAVEAIVYVLVGISAVILVCTHKKDCKTCDSKAAPMGGQPQM